MRHRISGNRLNRKSAHLKATIRDIAKSVLIHQRISTTKAKAKEARKLVDKLISLGKSGQLSDKRMAFAILCDHKLVSDLFNKISGRFNSRTGGYTRLIPLGNRKGDNAEMVFLELTEKEQLEVDKKKKSKTKKDQKEDKKSSVQTEEKKETKKVDVKNKEDDPVKMSEKTEQDVPVENKEKKEAKDVKSNIQKIVEPKKTKPDKKGSTRGLNKIKNIFRRNQDR